MATLVTVFGGSGFLGRRIVRRLARESLTIRVAVRQPRDADFPDLSDEPGRIVSVHADVRDEGSVSEALVGANAAINAVGLYVERGDETFRAVHIEGAQHVARQAAQAGLNRLIHISGIGVDPTSRSAYVRARAKGEAVAKEAFGGVTIVRPSVLFGPDDHVLNALAAVVKLSPFVPLFGPGRTRLQPVYVGDVAEAVARALSRPSSAGQIYELGGPNIFTYKALIELLLSHLDRKRIFVPVPFFAWDVLARAMALLPNPPLTRDQVVLMGQDNVVDEAALTLADLKIEPASVESILPNYFF